VSARVGTADSVHILVAWLTWSCALRDRLQAVLADPQTIPRDLAAVSREYWMTFGQAGRDRAVLGHVSAR
jgi:hypothetical protein